ncbi:MAG: nuclear transport factor 2 family protein [Nitrosospira sp.]
MTIASNLLHQHIQTFIEDNVQWQALIADDLLWELPYAPSLGHPARLTGRQEAMKHVTWFLGAVENFRFFDVKIYPFVDSEAAVAEFRAEGLIKSTGRIYTQNYVLFLRAAGGKITFLREYFDPVRAAKALDAPIPGLETRG